MRETRVKERLKHELRLLYATKEQSQNGKRNTGLDMARGVAIILIAAGHSSSVGGVPAVWLSTFHLPAFFLLSGWLMAMRQETEGSFKTVLGRKMKSIMIPYFWFSFASLLLDCVQLLRGKFTGETVWQHFLETISLQGYSVMWFLPVLLLAELGVFAGYKITARMKCSAQISYPVAALFWTVVACAAYYLYQAIAGTAIPAFWLGEIRIMVKAVLGAAFMAYGAGFFRLFGDREYKITGKTGLGAVGILCIAVNVVAAFSVQHMDLNNLNVGFLPHYLLLGTCGSLGLVFVCKLLPNIAPLTFFGQNSLIIMSTHLNFYVMYVAMRLTDVIAGGCNRTVWTILMLFMTFLLEIPVILLIRMFFPFVLGRARAHREVAEKGK